MCMETSHHLVNIPILQNRYEGLHRDKFEESQRHAPTVVTRALESVQSNPKRSSKRKRRTRRERLKSALYLSLKKRKTFFWKKLEIFEKIFLSENVA